MLLFFVYYGYIYYQEKPSANNVTTDIPRIKQEDRVLIFAPHCDDETISSSAILYDAIHTGGQVLVVFMTNGDGFTFAVEEQFKRIFLTSEDYIKSGFSRQGEALSALGSLGLSPLQITFLGYPDRGLESLWVTHWNIDNLLISHYTRSSHSPYSNSYEPHAPYAGESVLKNIEEILVRFRPTIVILPHPHDEHHDHAATYAFVTAALYKMDLTNTLHLPQMYYYLVHRGDFPIPHGYLPDNPLLPPKPLQSLNLVKWYSYPLNQEAEMQKYQATMNYTSQLKVPIMSKLLMSMIRTNELFAEIPVPKVISAASDINLLEVKAWEGGAPLLYNNPLAVHPAGVLQNSRRINTIYGYVQNSDIWLRLIIPKFSDSHWNYTLTYVSYLASNNNWSRDMKIFRFNSHEPGRDNDNISFSQNSVIIRIPNQKLPDFFYIKIVAKDWWGFTPDETAWYLALIKK